MIKTIKTLIDGVTLTFDPQKDGWIPHQYEETKQYSSFYPLQRDWTMVDVGGWIGLWATWAALHVDRVIALEPVSYTFQRLKENIHQNRGNTIIQKLAIGKKTGTAEIDVTGLPAASTMIPGAWNYGAEFLYEGGSKETVNVKTWDDWVYDERLEKIHLMNMDVEGGELSVLDGMNTVLPERISVARYHIPSPFHLIFQTLHEKGYVLDGFAYYDRNAKNRGKPHSAFFRLKDIPFQTPELYEMGEYELPTAEEADAGLPFYWGDTL